MDTPDYEYKIVVDVEGGYGLTNAAADGWEFVQAVTADHNMSLWRVVCIMRRKRQDKS